MRGSVQGNRYERMLVIAAVLALVVGAGGAAAGDPEHGVWFARSCGPQPAVIGQHFECHVTVIYLDETLIDSFDVSGVLLSFGVTRATGSEIISATNGGAPSNTNCRVGDDAATCRICPAFRTACGLNVGDPGFENIGQVTFRVSQVLSARDVLCARGSPFYKLSVDFVDNCESGDAPCDQRQRMNLKTWIEVANGDYWRDLVKLPYMKRNWHRFCPR